MITDHTLFPDQSGSISSPSAALRWSKEGKLQQQWHIAKKDRNGYVSFNNEWRDVPTEKTVSSHKSGEK